MAKSSAAAANGPLRLNCPSVSESSAQTITRIERPIATMARFLPWRWAIRW
jgi:hypothetical protein